MFRLIKVLFYLTVFLAFLLVGYAFLGDLSPERGQVAEPVQLDAN